MYIYDIVLRDAKNAHYAKRYVKYISACLTINSVNEPGYTEKHHILPKELYPEYKSFKKHPLNCAILTYRQHIIAHWILWKAFDSPNQAKAFFMMCNMDHKIPSRKTTHLYAVSRSVLKACARTGYCGYTDPQGNKHYTRIDDPRVLSGELKHHQSGKAYYRDSSNNILWLDCDDERVASGEVVHINLGVKKSEAGRSAIAAGARRTGVPAKDPITHKSLGRIPLCDPRWQTGDIVGMLYGMVVVKDSSGDIFTVRSDDSRYISGELLPAARGMMAAKDIAGNVYHVSVDDHRLTDGSLVSLSAGFGVYKNSIGDIKKLAVNDPRVASGEYYSIAVGRACYLDKNGDKHYVNTDDPRVLDGTLKSMMCGTGLYIDSSGKKLQLSVNDPRVLSGEVTGHSKGMAVYKNSSGDTAVLSINDPRVLSGEYVGINKGKKFSPEELAKRKAAIISAGRQAKLTSNGTPIGQIPLTDPRWKTGEIVSLRTDLSNPRRRVRSA